MAQQLVYTSSPKGLQPGAFGFCVVASTRGIPDRVASFLTSTSGYRRVFAPETGKGALNPVAYTHMLVESGAQTLRILSRVADAGLDYTNRTNKIASFLLLDRAEQPTSGPAAILDDRASLFYSTWNQSPKWLEPIALPNLIDAPTALCEEWRRATGSYDWGAALAATVYSGTPVTIVYAPDQNVNSSMRILKLFQESIRLLPPAMRWKATFSTYYMNAPLGSQCQWRAVLAGSQEEANLRANPRALLLDLTRYGASAPIPDAILRDANFANMVRQARGEATAQATPPGFPPVPPRNAAALGAGVPLSASANVPPSANSGSVPPPFANNGGYGVDASGVYPTSGGIEVPNGAKPLNYGRDWQQPGQEERDPFARQSKRRENKSSALKWFLGSAAALAFSASLAIVAIFLIPGAGEGLKAVINHSKDIKEEADPQKGKEPASVSSPVEVPSKTEETSSVSSESQTEGNLEKTPQVGDPDEADSPDDGGNLAVNNTNKTNSEPDSTETSDVGASALAEQADAQAPQPDEEVVSSSESEDDHENSSLLDKAATVEEPDWREYAENFIDNIKDENLLLEESKAGERADFKELDDHVCLCVYKENGQDDSSGSPLTKLLELQNKNNSPKIEIRFIEKINKNGSERRNHIVAPQSQWQLIEENLDNHNVYSSQVRLDGNKNFSSFPLTITKNASRTTEKGEATVIIESNGTIVVDYGSGSDQVDNKDMFDIQKYFSQAVRLQLVISEGEDCFESELIPLFPRLESIGICSIENDRDVPLGNLFSDPKLDVSTSKESVEAAKNPCLVISNCRIVSHDQLLENVTIRHNENGNDNKVTQFIRDKKQVISLNLKSENNQEYNIALEGSYKKKSGNNGGYQLFFKINHVRNMTSTSVDQSDPPQVERFFEFDLHYLMSPDNEIDNFTKIGILKIPCREFMSINSVSESRLNE